VQKSPTAVPHLPTFSDESASGLALLAEAASKRKVDTPKVQPCYAQFAPFQLRHDPTTKLPAKLVHRIENLEFVEMAEMLPETWASVIPLTHDSAMPRRPITRGPVTDILVWIECFGLLAGVLAKKFPDKAPELFAYLKRIVHASRNFEGSTWVAYDRAYRRQALASRSLDWSIEDPSLYNEAFVGHAKLIPKCRHCLSEHHTSEACALMTQFMVPWGLASPLQYQGQTFQPVQGPNTTLQEVCRKFNADRCFMRRCKFLHICSICSCPHPAVLCPRSGTRPGWDRERLPPSRLGRTPLKY